MVLLTLYVLEYNEMVPPRVSHFMSKYIDSSASQGEDVNGIDAFGFNEMVPPRVSRFINKYIYSSLFLHGRMHVYTYDIYRYTHIRYI